MTYSDMQRFKDALEGTAQDRVPVLPLIGEWAATKSTVILGISSGG